MAAPYVKRYPGGFLDLPTQTTPVDSAFLNAVEAALLHLLGEAPAADEVGVWSAAGGGALVYQKITNAQIAAGAAIDKSKLAALNIVDADVAAGAAIAKSKLAALNISDGDVAAGAGIAQSKLAPPDGWYPISETLTYGAADAPNYTVTTPSDVTAKYPVGSKIKLTHSGSTKYFIVVASAFAAGSTTLTLYGGTDYTLAASAITAPSFSLGRAPIGFPLNPDKWSVVMTDNAVRTQAAAVAGTWYNVGPLSISIPIGVWNVSWRALAYADGQGAAADMEGTLSTANNTEASEDYTAQIRAAESGFIGGTIGRDFVLSLGAKTTYFLNFKTLTGSSTIGFDGAQVRTRIVAVCAYL